MILLWQLYALIIAGVVFKIVVATLILRIYGRRMYRKGYKDGLEKRKTKHLKE